MEGGQGKPGALARPVPKPDGVSRGFWEAAARGELAIQRCDACGRFQHPPRPLCSACGSTALGFAQVSGQGRLWGWTVTHHSLAAGFEAALPYTCMVVELAEQEGLFMLSDLAGREEMGKGLKRGMAMRVTFPPAPDGSAVLPQFAPAGGQP